MAAISPAPDTSPAEPIVDGLRSFAESVLSLVPAGYDAYVRVFHPATRVVEGRLVPVRWSEVAAATGKHAHAGMQFEALTGSDQHDNQALPHVFDGVPDVGLLPESAAEPLVRVLEQHTTAADRCWFAIWEGWGGLAALAAAGPRFEVPNRAYHLVEGPIGAATWLADRGWGYAPSLWWPDDHAWCVATEIDLDTTYIGCTHECAGALVGAPELEALAIDPATGITYDSDELNPL